MFRFQLSTLLAIFAVLGAGCSAEIGPDDLGDAAESDLGQTQQAFSDVPGLSLSVEHMASSWYPSSAGPGVPRWEFGCGARFTDQNHMLQTRCILQELTPQTNSWRSISPWYVNQRVGSSGSHIVTIECTPNRVSILRTINRSALRTSSGGWTDLEELVGPAESVRCKSDYL